MVYNVVERIVEIPTTKCTGIVHKTRKLLPIAGLHYSSTFGTHGVRFDHRLLICQKMSSIYKKYGASKTFFFIFFF